MESSVRTLAKQLDVDMLVQACHRTVGIAEDILQDAILGVLAALLDREDEFTGRFPTTHHFVAYIRKAALRESIRVQKQIQREEPWQERSREETPESQFLAEEARYVASRQVSRLHLAVRQGLQELGKSQETIDHCETLLNELKARPEVYLQKRMSGKQRGTMVVDQAQLAVALDWDKRRVSERLRLMQLALQIHGWEAS